MLQLIRLIACAVVLVATSGVALAYPASVTADLNLRNGPGTRYAVITVIPRGAGVEVRSCSAGWCRVTYRQWRGFVSSRYLAQAGPMPPPVVTPPPYSYPPPIVIPRPPDRRRACIEGRARWALGLPASPGVIERARREANARTVRVLRPGQFYTQEFNRHRLSVEVDEAGIIIDVRCG